VLVGAKAEVLDGLAGVLGATEQQSVSAGGLLKSELVESQGLAAGSGDPGTSGGSEAQSGNINLGDLEEAVVVGDGADNNDRLLLVAVPEVGGNARERDRRAVDAAHEQAAEHDLVEGGVGAACEEGTPTGPEVSKSAFHPLTHSLPNRATNCANPRGGEGGRNLRARKR